MIGRRTKPDGLPYRLYERAGKLRVSYYYKLPDNTIAFTYSAPVKRPDDVAKARSRAIADANKLNGNTAPVKGTVAALFADYFAYHYSLPVGSEQRKASNTLATNEDEKRPLLLVFGAMIPQDIQPIDIAEYLDARAAQGAPAKANKEVALLSAVYEFGRKRRAWEITANPCSGVKYNKTKPNTRYVTHAELDLVMRAAEERGGTYRMVALSLYCSFLTVSRPEETLKLPRRDITTAGLEFPIGKRRAGDAARRKLIEWSPELRKTIDAALKLHITPSMYVFCNSAGQVYTRSGYNTILRRLMVHAARIAAEEGAKFERFTLRDMRPMAVTDRVADGDTTVQNSTGHKSMKMIQQVYDRRVKKKAKSTK